MHVLKNHSCVSLKNTSQIMSVEQKECFFFKKYFSVEYYSHILIQGLH